MSLNRIPTTVGYIIKKRRMPIGIDNCLNLRESISWPNWGRNLPTSKPATMQMVIHMPENACHTDKIFLYEL
jgi:hypothetical protein